MGNPHKGDVTFEAGGRSYTLRFSVDALCALEEVSGRGIVALSTELSDMDRVSLTLLRKVVWAGLREHHPDIDMKSAGELIVEAGGLAAMMGVVGTALSRAFPQGPEDGERPLVPGQNGTGPASARTGAH